MPNKPRLSESPNTDLFRMALLVALVPSCSITPTPRVATQGSGDIKNSVNYELKYKEHNREIIEDWKNDLTPIPDEVKNQILEISGSHMTAGVSLRNSDKPHSSYSGLYSEKMIIIPSAKRGGCHAKQKTITKRIPENSVASNATLLSEMLAEIGKVTINTVSINSSNLESSSAMVDNYATDDLRSFVELTYSHLINGYSIKRGVGGRPDMVELSVKLVECEKQRQDKTANIAAEVRSKLARGSKSGNRR